MSNVQTIFSGSMPRNQSLEQTPLRVLTFFYGLANHPEIEQQLVPAGYTKEAHQQGWDLLHACSGFGGMNLETSSTPAAAAIRELSTWCGHSFGRIQAALTHLHPDEEAYVFQGLVPVTGPAAVVAVELMLERLDDLAGTGKNAAVRKDKADADKKALATLAVRGFDDKELKRVHDLVTTAHLTSPSDDNTKGVSTLTQEQALTALRAWYEDWSTTAHDVIEKRADLIRIGLAKPRKAKAAPPVDASAPATPVTVPAGATAPVVAATTAPAAVGGANHA